MRKQIFITGAAGFIGYHVAKKFVERGDQVLGFDNFNSYYSLKLKRDRQKELKGLGVEIVEGDLCNQELLSKVCQSHQTTHLVHLAAQAGVRYSLDNPQAYVKSNFEGFLNVLEVCRHQPEVKLTYASSSSVYGDNRSVPFCEVDRTDQQSSLYGVTKKSNELMAAAYHRLFGISVTGLRFFTVYGPWGRPDMAYYSFSEAILKGTPIQIYNQGVMQRDFTYIEDIVEGVVAAVELKSGCHLFNLGNNQPVKLSQFVEILEEALGKKAVKTYVGMQKGDVKQTFADITLSKQKLQFNPKTSLKEGICQFVSWLNWYKSVSIR